METILQMFLMILVENTTSLTSEAQTTVDGSTYYWNVVAGDGYENQTITSTWGFTENTKPSISGAVLAAATINNKQQMI